MASYILIYKSLFTDHKIVIHLYKFVSYEFNHNLQKGLDWVSLLGKISFKDLNENFWI